MGGQLAVESEPEKGAVFFFTIDLVLATHDAAGTSALDRGDMLANVDPADTPVPAGCILVAEDTPVNQMVIRKHLEDQGHHVQLVGNGREAVEACRKKRFDLIILDVQMPEMDGLEAARRIRAQSPLHEHIPLVALTANSDTKTRKDCEAAGMDVVMTKPIRRAELLAGVNRWLCGPPASRSSAESNGVQDIQAPVTEIADGAPPLDLETATYEFGDRDMVREVVGNLIESVSAQIIEIRQAHAAGDFEHIRKRSHAIKGGAATVEARQLAARAADLEQLCQDQAGEDVAPTIEKLVGAFEELKQYAGTVSW